MGSRALSVVTMFVLVGAAAFVAAAPAGATTVTTEAELRTAFANDSVVDLGADITLTDCTGNGAVLRPVTNTDPVTLDGHGFTVTQTCASSVILQNSTAALTVRNLTVTGGKTVQGGGGVSAQGDLTIEDSVLTGNRADLRGGGAAANGALVVRRSSVVGNATKLGGGGLAGVLDITVVDSNVSENINGGIATGPAESAQLTVINTTIHHNTEGGLGAGIFSGGNATLVYATITDNEATSAFANVDVTGTLSSFGSVVTGHGSNANCLVGVAGGSLGYNFSDDASCKFTAPTDRMSAGSPQLGPLGSNGGPTQSQLPLVGSPLLDAIPAAACAPDVPTDQRGVARPQAGFCDIGAVEVEVPTPTPLTPVVTPLVVTPRFTG